MLKGLRSSRYTGILQVPGPGKDTHTSACKGLAILGYLLSLQYEFLGAPLHFYEQVFAYCKGEGEERTFCLGKRGALSAEYIYL